MSWRGRLKLIRWNYNAIFSTISASKEYILKYIQTESKLKVARKALFDSWLFIKEALPFRNEVLVTDFIYMHLPDFFKTLKMQGMRNLELRFVNPMNLKSKNLSFIFLTKFPEIKKSIEQAQKDGVLTKKPRKGSLLHLINNLYKEPAEFEKPSKQKNSELIKKNFDEGKQIIDCYPSKLFIELTRNCNCSCIMCGREKPSYDESLNMKFDLFKQIADRFFPYADYVDLRGFGETTLIYNIDEYIDYALKYDCDFGIITNMTVKNDKLWEKLILNNFWLGVSLDAANKATYQKIRRHGNYDNVIHNFELIRNISKKHKIKNRVYLVVTVQSNNIEEIPDIIRLAAKYDIKKVELSPVILPYEGHPCGLVHVKERVKPNIRKALELGEKLEINTSLIGTFGLEEKEKAKGHKLMNKCPRPWSWLYINYDGKIGPCNHLMDPLFVLGDLNAGEGEFEKELNNEPNQFMRAIIHTPYRYKSCEWCFKNRYDY